MVVLPSKLHLKKMIDYCTSVPKKSKIKLSYYIPLSIKEYLKKLYLYEIKAKVISSGLCQRIKKYDKAQMLKVQEGIIDQNVEYQYFEDINIYGLCLMDQARKINYASYKRIDRLRKRITRYMSMGLCTWVTLTFKEEVLDSTNLLTRRKYVSRFLKTLCSCYVANIDYGDDDAYTHREHYHAMCVGDIRHDDTKWWRDNMGFTFLEYVRNKDADKVRISKYISKLTNHAIKKSTKRQVYIYSRG